MIPNTDSTDRQIIATTRAPASPYFSQAIRVGELVFVAGQGPWRADSDDVVGNSIEDQTALTLENVKVILEAAGASMQDVVKATVHLSDMQLFERFNQVYARYFPDPRPVRTTVDSQLVGILVEVDVIAVVKAKS